MFSHTSSSQIENSNATFISEKLEKSDEIVNEVNKLTINDAVYKLNTSAARDAQGDLKSDP